MTPKRLLVLFLAMAGASLLTQMVLRIAGAQDDLRIGAGWFAMTMAAWLVEKEWIHEHLLFGRSFATWLVAMLAITVLVGWLMSRLWPA